MKDHGQHKFTDVEQFLSGKCPFNLASVANVEFEPFGFGLNDRHAATRQRAYAFWLGSV